VICWYLGSAHQTGCWEQKKEVIEKLLIQLLEVWNSREKGAFLASFDLLSSST